MRTRARASAGDPPGGDGSMAFVTVGTTKFDALVAAIDDKRLGAALAARGFRRLVMQVRCVAGYEFGKTEVRAGSWGQARVQVVSPWRSGPDAGAGLTHVRCALSQHRLLKSWVSQGSQPGVWTPARA